MNWQEELSRLDAVLASGRITAEEYRRRRDEILSGSAGGSPAQPAGQVPASNSFPPPFKWQKDQQPVPPGQQEPQDRTQVVPNATAQPAQPGDSDRTQVVSAGNASSERTQFVRPVMEPQGGWQAVPPQNQYAASSAPPPWTTGDSDQVSPPQWNGGGFHTHGPEVFDDKPAGKGKLFAILGVVLVLVVGGVLWFTVFRDKGGTTADPSQSNPPATSQSPTKKKLATFGTLIVPEGTKNGPTTYTMQQLEVVKALPAPDLVLLKNAGVSESRSVIVTDGKSNTISMWAFKCADPAALLDAIEVDQLRFEFLESADESKPSVKVFASRMKDAANQAVYVRRGHYTVGDEVIRVEVLGPDEAGVVDTFSKVLAEQLQHTPAK